jgi:hypothetical protein
VIAFIVALIAIRTFIGYVQKHSFRAFGFYRIIVGASVIVLIQCGVLKRSETAAADKHPQTNISIIKK